MEGGSEVAPETGETDREEQTVDLFGEAATTHPAGERESADSGDEEEADGELEDDFNAAWEVLEVARSLYESRKDSDDEAKLKLADTYIALGDVSLETGRSGSKALSCHIDHRGKKNWNKPLATTMMLWPLNPTSFQYLPARSLKFITNFALFTT